MPTLPTLSEELIAQAEAHPVELLSALLAEETADRYRQAYPGVPWVDWLIQCAPKSFLSEDQFVPFADYHREFWEWVFAIRKTTAPRPFLACWPRDSGKSTAAEAACVYVGGEGLRRYGLYVSSSQAQADDHVASVAALLESRHVAERYPMLSQRSVNQYGQSKGWRVNRLRTAAGFTLDAIGLDKAVRGARLEEQRPDWICLDDLDSDHDTPRMVERKIELMTRSLLPAGDRQNLAVLFVQNLVHDDSIVARMLDKRTDLLSDAIVSGPHPAIRDLTYEQQDTRVVLTGGTPTWAGLTLEMCQRIVQRFTLRAFLAEYQHERGVRSGALWAGADLDQHRVVGPPPLRRVVVAIDPAASSSPQGSETGICVVGEDGALQGGLPHYYVLRDQTDHYTPDQWARMAIQSWTDFQADGIVAEANQGGDMVADVIGTRAPHIRVHLVKAKRGKYTRAEPVAGLSEQGRLHMVGRLMMLEKQLCTPYDPDSTETTFDRMDAMVWGVTFLAFGEDQTPHYDRTKHGYVPEQPDPARVFPLVDAEQVAAWREGLARGAFVHCEAEEWPVLRAILVDTVEKYGPAGDHRGFQALEQLNKMDVEFGKGGGKGGGGAKGVEGKET